MKKSGLFIMAIAISCISVLAQESSLICKNGGVWQGAKKLSANEVKTLMATDANALKTYKNGRTLSGLAYVIVLPSAFLLGYDSGARLGGGGGNTAMLTIGAVGTIAGIFVSWIGEKKIKHSIQLYNSKPYNTVSYRVNLGFNQTGAGLSVNF